LLLEGTELQVQLRQVQLRWSQQREQRVLVAWRECKRTARLATREKRREGEKEGR
jgi:hypothetical protein